MKSQRKVKLNVASKVYLDTKYPVVTSSAKELGWSVTQGNDWDITWRDGSVSLTLLSKMKKSQKINHFPGMFEISRKNCLAKNLNRFRESFPNDYDFYPQTWILPQDFNKLKSVFKDNCPTLIVKPEASSQGKGIYLVDTWEELNFIKNSIAQVYVNNPLLIDGLKFDLRIYVLITGCDPLRVYIHEEGLARFATEAYEEPDLNNKTNRYMHLTNYAINKLNTNFIQNDDDSQNHSHKRSLSSVLKDLELQGRDSAGLWDDICDLIIKTLLTAQPFLSSTYKSAQSHDFMNAMCFEVLGFDILIDNDLRPWLLEVNFTPSFSTDSQLDFRIKSQVIQDTLQTINLSEKKKQKFEKIHSEYLKKRNNSTRTKQDQAELRFYAQEIRDTHEDMHRGGFIKIYPAADQFCYSKFLKHSQILWTGGLLELIYVPKLKRTESNSNSLMKSRESSLKPGTFRRISESRKNTLRKVLNFDSLDTNISKSKSRFTAN